MSQNDNFAMLVSEDIKNNASQQDKDFSSTARESGKMERFANHDH